MVFGSRSHAALPLLDHKIFGAPAEHIAVKVGSSVDTIFVGTAFQVRVFAVNHGSPGSPYELTSLSFNLANYVFSLAVSPTSPLVLVGTRWGLVARDYRTGTTFSVPGGAGTTDFYDIVINHSGTLAFALRNATIYILNISNPASIYEAGTIVASNHMTGLAFKGSGEADTLFAAGVGHKALRIYDVSNPSAPSLITTSFSGDSLTNMNKTFNSVVVINDSIYVAQQDSGYRTFGRNGVSDQPGKLTYIPGSTWNLASAQNDSLLVICSNNGFRTHSIIPPGGISDLIALPNNSPYDAAGGWSYLLYFAFGRKGFQIFDIGNPIIPVQLGPGIETGDIVYDIAGDERNYAYVANGVSGVRIIDLVTHTQVGSPIIYTEGESYGRVLVRNNILYAFGGYNIYLINITNPASPILLGSYSGFGANDAALSDSISGSDTLLVVSHVAGVIKILDVKNPQNITQYSSIFIPSGVNHIRLSGRSLFAALGQGGIASWVIFNPVTPIFMDSLMFAPPPSPICQFEKQGKYIYHSSGDSVGRLDVSSPSNLVNLGNYLGFNGGSWCLSFAPSGKYLHVGYVESKINIVDTTTNSIVDSFYGLRDAPRRLKIIGKNLLVAAAWDGYYHLGDEYGFESESAYVDSFTVSIPDTFLVGPGRFPGDTISLPIFMNPAMYNQHNGVYSFQAEITYNDSLFKCVGYDSTGTVLGNYGGLSPFTVQFRKDSGNYSTLDTLRIAAASDDSLYYPEVAGTPFEFPRPLIKLKFRIPTTAHNGDSTILHFARFMFNEGVPGTTTDDGSIKLRVRKLGDVDKNQLIQPYDAVLVLRYVIRDTTLDAESRIAAEVSGNGEITAYDAALILMHYVGKITTFPAGNYYKNALPSNRNAELALEWGELKDGMLTLLVNAKNLAEVYGYSMEMAYDPSALVFQGAGLTDFTQGMINVVATEEGKIRIAAAGPEAIEGEGALVRLTFRIAGETADENMIRLTQVVLNEEVILSEASSVAVPKTFALEQNYPNPFNPQTRIRFRIPETAQVEIVIYNLLGQKVKTLSDGVRSAGVYDIIWDGTNDNGVKLASGMYLYRMKTGSFVQTRKLIFMK